MSDCEYCPVEAECRYPYKPCDCVFQRKFWTEERRAQHDREEEEATPHPRDVELAKAGMLDG